MEVFADYTVHVICAVVLYCHRELSGTLSWLYRGGIHLVGWVGVPCKHPSELAGIGLSQVVCSGNEEECETVQLVELSC